MSKPKDNYGQNSKVGIVKHSWLLEAKGSIHKWKEKQLYYMNKDFRQPEKQNLTAFVVIVLKFAMPELVSVSPHLPVGWMWFCPNHPTIPV